MTPLSCPTCGRPIDEHNRHVRLLLPDPVLRVPPEERAARTWGRDPLLQVQGVGAFVRVLLPIHLTEGHALTIGTWLAVNPQVLPELWERWNTPEYATIELEGFLANAIPPWGDEVLGVPASAAVTDPAHVPYLRSGGSSTLGSVLTHEWPHEPILEAYRRI